VPDIVGVPEFVRVLDGEPDPDFEGVFEGVRELEGVTEGVPDFDGVPD